MDGWWQSAPCPPHALTHKPTTHPPTHTHKHQGKSAFALEMDDVRVLLRDCTPRSLVLLDEIGKGTSARDGAALSGALLEALDAVPVTAVFATHLHELFDLPLATRHLAWKRMGMEGEGEGEGGEGVRWTYRLEDGRCADSMALHTARWVGAGGLLFFVCYCLFLFRGWWVVCVDEIDGPGTQEKKTRALSSPSSLQHPHIHTHKPKPKPQTNTGPTASRTPSSSAPKSWATPSTPPAAPPPPPLPPPLTTAMRRGLCLPPPVPPRPLFLLLLLTATAASATTRRLPRCARWTGPPPSFGGWRRAGSSRGGRKRSRQ